MPGPLLTEADAILMPSYSIRPIQSSHFPYSDLIIPADINFQKTDHKKEIRDRKRPIGSEKKRNVFLDHWYFQVPTGRKKL